MKTLRIETDGATLLLALATRSLQRLRANCTATGVEAVVRFEGGEYLVKVEQVKREKVCDTSE